MSRRAARIQRVLPQYERKPSSWLRDSDHLDWVATLPCLGCGRRGHSVPAHVRLYGDGAGSRKPSDNKVVPLCELPGTRKGCHHVQHDKGEVVFYAGLMAKGISDPWGVAQRLYRITGDTERGYAAIQRARPGLLTAWLLAA